MSKIQAHLLFKHDEDNFTLQHVKIKEQAYLSMLREYTCLSGSIEDILDRLPFTPHGVNTSFSLVFVNGGKIQAAPMRVESSFWDKFIEHDYYSPASSKTEVIISIENLLDDRIPILLDEEQAFIAREVLDMTMQDCSDFNEHDQLRQIVSVFNRAINDASLDAEDLPEVVEQEGEMEI